MTTTEERGDGISDEMVDRALDARFRTVYDASTAEDNEPGRGPMRAALVAAGVPDLISDRDRARRVASVLEAENAFLRLGDGDLVTVYGTVTDVHVLGAASDAEWAIVELDNMAGFAHRMEVPSGLWANVTVLRPGAEVRVVAQTHRCLGPLGISAYEIHAASLSPTDDEDGERDG